MSPKKYPILRRTTYIKRLPDVACQFLYQLEPIRKPATCRTYQSNLRAFHTYLQRNRLSLESLDREQMTQWFVYLNNQGLSPATRSRLLIDVRIYLRWLHERGVIFSFPDELIRNADLPKRPKYLPRPLPPEIDRELQQKFAQSQSVVKKGLLLLRKTGMRVGELISLPYECIYTDYCKNNFLKVPLGKLNNERLVPINRDTLELIQNIQSTYPPNRAYLIQSPTGSKARYYMYWHAFQEAIEGIETQEPITIHQLRHSFATELTNAGMRIECLQPILGHLDYRMTLRYSKVTLETVTKEFYKALAISEEKYRVKFQKRNDESFDPIAALTDLNQWLHNSANSSTPHIQRQARLLIRRVQRMKNDFEKITQTSLQPF